MITCLTLLYGHIHLPLFSFNKLIKQDLCLPGRKTKQNKTEPISEIIHIKKRYHKKPSRFHYPTNLQIN